MKVAILAGALTVACAGYAQAQQSATPAAPAQRQPGASELLQQKIAPGLARYTNDVLFGEVWPGSGLSPRDRSLTVISVLIATNKVGQLPGHLARALRNGVSPVEASGVVTHLALYTGWPSAVSVLEVYDRVFTERKVDFSAIQASSEPLPPTSGEADAISAKVASIAPKFADLSKRVVFGDLWRRADLNVRDRSLVTIAALASTGDSDLLPPYLHIGVEAGLKKEEIAEALTQLAFYAGWGKATRALNVLSETFPE